MKNKIKELAQESYDSLPFKTALSFEPLYRRVKEMFEAHDTVYTEKGREALALMETRSDMLKRSLSDEELEANGDAVRLLMHFVFPQLEDSASLCKAYKPYTMEPFFTTSKFQEIIEADHFELSLSESMHNQFEGIFREDMLFAYKMLFDIHFEKEHNPRELVIKVRDTKRDLDRYFTISYSFRYADVDLGGLEVMPRERFARLLIMRDLEGLQAAMPLDSVTFYGFLFARYIEATERENISQLKSELVERDALSNRDKFNEIVRRLRSILQVEDLEAGLLFHYRATSHNHHCVRRSLMKDYPGGVDQLLETVFSEVFNQKKPVFVPNLDECQCAQGMVDYMKSKGVQAVGIIPLIEDEKPIAALELTSRQAETISSHAERKLADLLPVLTIAVRQEMDEFESRIERTIKSHCTAIHPSVEWRFVEAATRYLNASNVDAEARFDDIEFQDVHPMYGSMDIRSSSEKRNQAIQADLLDHLSLVSKTLELIDENKAIPVADYYLNAVRKYEASVREDLDSGDELSIIEFLQARVEPFFEFVRENEPDMADMINEYFDTMAPGMGMLNRRRSEYEESVALLNDTLSRFLEKEQEEAQAIFPHYFEKYRTDGVEYNMYVGQSMAQTKTFEEFQLKNLRLWQLMSMCKMTRLADSLTKAMTTRLSCAPLILAHSAPLTIQFRVDEKRFEVEGSYNVRYEIIKKRIDKSTLMGSSERLTQPGLLSVIYTQEKEREEYLGYFDYLRDKGFIEGEVENLSIEDQEGVHGLRALRAKVVS